MDRKSLEAQGLTPEQIEFIMSENGKDIQSEQTKAKQALTDAIAKATEPLNGQITELTKQNAELQDAVKNASGVDENAKKQIEELTKTHTTTLEELKKKHDEDLAIMRRQADTKEFFQTLGKKFVTPETQRAFEQRLNDALGDKQYEGKNRSDILSILTMGEDGKERVDIYAPEESTKPPAATGDTNPPPNGGSNGGIPKVPPTII